MMKLALVLSLFSATAAYADAKASLPQGSYRIKGSEFAMKGDRVTLANGAFAGAEITMKPNTPVLLKRGAVTMERTTWKGTAKVGNARIDVELTPESGMGRILAVSPGAKIEAGGELEQK
jgi:hypothetical protein